MALTTEELRKIAMLARLRLSPEEEGRLADQLGKIVDYVDQLRRFETGEVSGGAGEPPPEALPEAEDVPHACLPRESFLANAPAALDAFLLVPAVKWDREDRGSRAGGAELA
jgi:aspartyl-tRNA(Asn)/glutamyl-tRNA(Gln) amidotransferase subunit C